MKKSFAYESIISDSPVRFIWSGVFVSDEDFNQMVEMRKELLQSKNLPYEKTQDGFLYGWDYDGRIVRSNENGREELDIYFNAIEMDKAINVIDGIVQKNGFPKSTQRCVFGIQENKEITICIHL
uniref:Uncharacterized protein n=1 Tax=viral metagenome TaxID=1070528 RepID=A0A6H2A2H3_9ZZZZ